MLRCYEETRPQQSQHQSSRVVDVRRRYSGTAWALYTVDDAGEMLLVLDAQLVIDAGWGRYNGDRDCIVDVAIRIDNGRHRRGRYCRSGNVIAKDICECCLRFGVAGTSSLGAALPLIGGQAGSTPALAGDALRLMASRARHGRQCNCFLAA